MKTQTCSRRVAVALSVLAACAAFVDGRTLSASDVAPYWIWGPDDATALTFTKSFAVDDAVQQATLQFAADFCFAAVTINGRRVLAVEPYCQTQTVDVTESLRRGANQIAVAVEGIDGPRAIALSLEISTREGKTIILSDEQWSLGGVSADMRAKQLGRVRSELWGVGRRPATISPLENYEQWRQAGGATSVAQPKFWTVPDFEIVQLRAAGPDDGSWIAMAFDTQGRLTISREDKGLLRLSFDDEHRRVTKFERIDADLKECRGLLYADGFLYANANNSKAMYRLKLDDDGNVADRQLLREFPGDVGHGRNDLTLGADVDDKQWLYSIHGDAVQPPGEPIVDRTSPLRESRRVKPRKEGYVVRTDLDGKHWELWCTGLRNPYGIASDKATGDLFTYDADNEFDMGTPWYRPTRIVQLMSGADYGYHPANGEWPPRFHDQPDNAVPLIDVGRGSPTAVLFGDGLKFPPPYRDALYILDWTYGRVLAMHMSPRGNGYRAALELFLQGMPLNVTDIAAGPDGAMYLTTGGRKTQSALYRVAYVGSEHIVDGSGPSKRSRGNLTLIGQTPPTWAGDEPHEFDCVNHAARAWLTRVILERSHGIENIYSGTDIPLVGLVDDPIWNHAERVATESLPVEHWIGRATATLNKPQPAEQSSRERRKSIDEVLGASTMLVRTGRAEPAAAIVERLTQISSGDLNLGQRLFVVFLYRRCLENASDAVAARRAEIIAQLLKLWPNLESEGVGVSPYGTSAELRRRLAILLGDLDAAESIAPITDTLLASPVQEDRLAGLLALRNRQEGWTLDQRRKYFAALNDGTKFVGGEGMPQFLGRLRSDALASLSADEAKQLADVVNPPPPVVEPPPQPRPIVERWTLATLNSLYADDAVKGDAARGATVFHDALCARCHRAGLTGPAVGPELTFVARRFSRRDMLESILTPSLSVAENYRNTHIVTNNGKTYTGRLLSEGDFRSEKLKLSVDPLRPGEIVEIDKKDIAEYAPTTTSPMPQGLLDSFSPQEIADLLAYLEAGGAVPPP